MENYKVIINLVRFGHCSFSDRTQVLHVLGENIEPTHADFFLVPHVIRAFVVCLEEFSEASKADIPAVFDVCTKLVVAMDEFFGNVGELIVV